MHMMSQNVVHYDIDMRSNFSELNQNIRVNTNGESHRRNTSGGSSSGLPPALSPTFRDVEGFRLPPPSHQENSAISFIISPIIRLYNSIKLYMYSFYMANFYLPYLHPIAGNPKVVSAVHHFRKSVSPVFCVFLTCTVALVLIGFCYAVANLFIVFNPKIVRGVKSRVVWV